MKVDLFLRADRLSDSGEQARRLEAIGCDGVASFEGPHDPFLPLVMAAQSTERAQLYPGIAVAFARNPMSLANLGNDMQHICGGRFMLGLGTQIRPHIEKRYNMRWSGKPVAQMRELLQAIRAIWAAWEGDGRLRFEGEHYRHTLMTPFFNPGANPHGWPPILLAAVGPAMTKMVGEEADGLLIHPFSTMNSLRQLTLPALAEGVAAAGREAGAVQKIGQVIVALAEDEASLKRCRDMARAQLAFYASTPAYRPVLECEGWGDLQPRLNTLSKEGKWQEMGALVGDEMLEAMAVCGAPDDVAEQLKSGRASLVDRIAPSAYAEDEALVEKLVRALKS